LANSAAIDLLSAKTSDLAAECEGTKKRVARRRTGQGERSYLFSSVLPTLSADDLHSHIYDVECLESWSGFDKLAEINKNAQRLRILEQKMTGLLDAYNVLPKRRWGI